MRFTRAPSLVWCWMSQRKMSPTLMCTRLKSSFSILACVPLPLPCTPMITYLRITPPLERLLKPLDQALHDLHAGEALVVAGHDHPRRLRAAGAGHHVVDRRHVRVPLLAVA